MKLNCAADRTLVVPPPWLHCRLVPYAATTIRVNYPPNSYLINRQKQQLWLYYWLFFSGRRSESNRCLIIDLLCRFVMGECCTQPYGAEPPFSPYSNVISLIQLFLECGGRGNRWCWWVWLQIMESHARPEHSLIRYCLGEWGLLGDNTKWLLF